jgi:hypothetical protein
MPWRPRINVTRLKQAHDELAHRLLRVREELQVAERHRVGLEIALSVRGEKIEELNGKLERARLENDCLVEMLAAPPVDAMATVK